MKLSPLEAAGRLLFGSGDIVVAEDVAEMLIILSQLTLGDNLPMVEEATGEEVLDNIERCKGGADDGKGGGRVEGNDGGPEGGG